MTKQPVNTLDQTNTSRLDATRRSLEQREDVIGQSYRTIRDNPKTSAAIAGGVVAAAGAGAFLLNRRKNQIGTATGHASSSEDINQQVSEMNNDAVSSIDKTQKTAFSKQNEEISSQSKPGAVAY